MFTFFLPLIVIIIVIIIISTPLTTLRARMEAAAHRRAGAAGVPLLNQSGVPYVFQKLQPGSPLLADFNFTEVWPPGGRLRTAVLHSNFAQLCTAILRCPIRFVAPRPPRMWGRVRCCGAYDAAARWRTRRCWRACSRSSTSVPR
jgi:hypothetical protein